MTDAATHVAPDAAADVAPGLPPALAAVPARVAPGPAYAGPERRRDEPDPAAVGFVLQLARALHVHGYSAQRLEDVLGVLSDRLGLVGHRFFSTPTSIMAAFGPEARQRTHLLRVEPGDVDLGKLAELEHVSLEVALGRLAPADGAAEVLRVVAAPPPYAPPLVTLAHGVLSGAVCQFLGGGVREIAIAALLGLGLGVFQEFALRHRRVNRVFEPLAAFLVSALAIAFANAAGPIAIFVTTLAGLIVLLPGLTLTTAITELATRNLASGTARLSGAFMTLLGIAFGVALGTRVATAALGAPPALDAAAALPPWTGIAALLLAPLASVVILRAVPKDAPWIVVVGVIGVLAGRLGAATLGVELGTFAGAFAVALASSAYERWRRRPAAVVLVPGILLLVPGSVGYRSISALMERDTVAGIERAFSMILTAVALVAGLLIAGVLAPEPRVRDGHGR